MKPDIIWSRISPACKYVVWIVQTSSSSTTNPMTKRAAMKIIKDRLAAGKHARLIKAWSCVSSKNLMAGHR